MILETEGLSLLISLHLFKEITSWLWALWEVKAGQ